MGQDLFPHGAGDSGAWSRTEERLVCSPRLYKGSRTLGPDLGTLVAVCRQDCGGGRRVSNSEQGGVWAKKELASSLNSFRSLPADFCIGDSEASILFPRFCGPNHLLFPHAFVFLNLAGESLSDDIHTGTRSRRCIPCKAVYETAASCWVKFDNVWVVCVAWLRRTSWTLFHMSCFNPHPFSPSQFRTKRSQNGPLLVLSMFSNPINIHLYTGSKKSL